MTTRHPNARGFTLLELMIVLVITAILAGGAVTSYQKTRQSASLDGKENELLSVLQRAKAESAVRSVPVGCSVLDNGVFCFTRKDNQISLATTSLDNDGDGLPDSNAGDVAELIAKVRFNPDVSIFDPAPAGGIQGTATGAASFYFIDDGSVLDGNSQPTGLTYTLRLGTTGNQLAWNSSIRLRSTGSITKEY